MTWVTYSKVPHPTRRGEVLLVQKKDGATRTISSEAYWREMETEAK